jgi:hypothetical protein
MDVDGADDDESSMEDAFSEGGMDEFQATHVAQQTAALKKDFLEIVAYEWRPGLVRFGSNEFGMSPLTSLFNSTDTCR